MSKNIWLNFILILSITTTLSASEELLEEDDVFYNDVQKELEDEVKIAKAELMTQAKVVEVATKNYAAAKVKQNFFKALRVLAENELERISMQDRLRQPRQVVRQDEDGDEDEDATTVRTVPLIPVAANILKAVFGGNNETGAGGLNLTYHIQNVQKFISRPFEAIGTRINGIQTQVSELGNGIGTLLGLRTTEAPIRIVQIVPINATSDTVVKLLKTAKAKPYDDIPAALIVEDDRANYTTQQPQVSTSTTVAPSANQSSTLETAQPGVIYIDELTKNVQDSLDGLIKAMPDLFEGTREVITLINNIRELIDS